MKIASLDYYRCPNCRWGNFSLEPGHEPSAEPNNGNFKCRSCGASYPIRDEIPRFAAAGNYSDSFGLQWNLHRQTQLDSYTGRPISRNRLFETTGWPTNLKGQFILEAGSGAGRFTEILLATGATVFSFDYSSAVDANCANNGKHPHLNLFQGDVFSIPLRQQSFDKVLCLGVLQHTPDPWRAVNSLALYLKPGGELVIDVYARRLVSLLSWKYLLRPLTKRLDKEMLYKMVATTVPILLPLAIFFRRIAGRYGGRLLPIVEYSHLGLPYELNQQWAILDTFDMYSPKHDHPQSIAAVKRWFLEVGFSDIKVRYGPNGIIAKGRRPE